MEGFQVEAALDGLAGGGLVRSFRPEVVIVDLMLPKLTGVELTKKVSVEDPATAYDMLSETGFDLGHPRREGVSQR